MVRKKGKKRKEEREIGEIYGKGGGKSGILSVFLKPITVFCPPAPE